MASIQPIFDSQRFRQGLDRVAKVVEGVGDYDSILYSKGNLKKRHYTEAVSAHAEGRVDELNTIVSSEIRLSKAVVYALPAGVRTLSYARTHNNKVELAFLARKCADFGPYNICDLANCERLTWAIIGELPGVDEAEELVRAFFVERAKLSASLLRQVFMYVGAYFSFLLTLSRESASLRGLLLANDHSPIPVALSMVAAQLGMRRVYLQHAEVTEIFPPLDFEYSILRNRKSERIYRAIGEMTGDVRVICRRYDLLSEDEIVRRMVLHTVSDRVAVGLYPSSVYDETSLRKVAAALLANPSVNQIFLKPHPSLNLTGLALELNIEYFSQAPIQPHVAIVGNSSVALELALSGHLVFQLFELDSVGDDYYGFHADGLTGKISVADMYGPFWTKVCFGDERKAAVARRVADERGEMPDDEAKFFRRLLIDLGCMLQMGQSRAERLASYFRMYPASTVALFRGGRHRFFGEFDLLVTLNQVFDARQINLSNCYRYFDFSVCESVLDFWFISKRVEWNGQLLKAEVGRSLLAFSRRPELDHKIRGWVESKLFDLFLRSDQDDLLGDLLDNAARFSLTKTSINRKIAFIRKLQRAPETSKLHRYYDHRFDALGGLEKLKINVQCELHNQNGLLYTDYRQVEKEYLRNVHSALAEEYDRLVRQAYTTLEPRCRFIDVKRNSEQAEQLIELIVARLRDRTPFAVVRLSDGEGYLFREKYPYFSEVDARNRERHWWGEELDEITREKVTQAGRSAVRNADIVGIPSIYRFLRDCSVKSISLLTSLQGRGLVSVLQGVAEQASASAEFGDDKLNLAVFNRMDCLQRLAAAARKIVVVNGAQEQVLIDTFASLGEIKPIVIPTHQKTLGNEKFGKASRPLPYLYENICAQIERESGPGALVLVGAGIAGKAFIESAKRTGGVGLDLGSAMDTLVGAGVHSLH